MSTELFQEKSTEPEWISQAEAARVRGVTRQAIAKLVQRRRFRTLTIGGHTLVHRGDVEAFTPRTPGRPTIKAIDAKQP